ncbi:MAG TPA: LamG-like jellyroll fold domain-containing protein [Lacipirellula sp.]
MKTASRILFAVVALICFAPQQVDAATQAYWRHEEGPAGALVPDGFDTVLDSSGNGNHMVTFSSGFTPYTAPTYSSTVSPLALRSGLPNTLSLDFGTGSDGVTPEGGEPNDDNFTVAEKPISSQVFNEITVELSFRMKTIGGFQALVGKDGKPLGDALGEDDNPVPPFKIVVRGDGHPGGIPNQLAVEFIDGDGMLNSDVHLMALGETVVPDQWYHAAVTINATDAALWVAGETTPYEMVDSITGDFAGPSGNVLVQEPLGWTIGRGMFNNGVTDWSNALIDEVRISDSVLTPEEFLFVAAAGPAEDADFDGDGDVDGQDFLTFQRNIGTVGTPTTGDANGDLMVDGADLAIFREQFGTSPSGAAAIPEPATLGLALSSLAALAYSQRKGRQTGR